MADFLSPNPVVAVPVGLEGISSPQNQPPTAGDQSGPSDTKEKPKKSKSSKPKSKKSSSKNKDDAKRKAEMETKIRRRVATEEKAFRLVESMLEDGITESFLIAAGAAFSREHYQDVVEERSITALCGYPICSNTLRNVPNKKYHISSRDNKVYDITDRKKFCSNQCCKASQYFEKQISLTPVWLRGDEEPVLFDLLRINNRGSLGLSIIANPALEIKSEVKELDKIDTRRGFKPQALPSTSPHKATQRSPNTSGGELDLCCEGQAIRMSSESLQTVEAGDQVLRSSVACGPDLGLGALRIDIPDSNVEDHEVTPDEVAKMLGQILIKDAETQDNSKDGPCGAEMKKSSLMDKVELFSVRSDTSERDDAAQSVDIPATCDTPASCEMLDQSTVSTDVKNRSDTSVLESSRTYILESSETCKDESEIDPVPSSRSDGPSIEVSATSEEEQASASQVKTLLELLDKRNQLLEQKKQMQAEIDKKELKKGELKELNKTEQKQVESMKQQSGSCEQVQTTSETVKVSKPSKASVLMNIKRAQQQISALANVMNTTSQNNSKVISCEVSDLKGNGKSQPGRKLGKKVKMTPLDLMKKTLFEWKTAETVRYLNSSGQNEPPDEFNDKYRQILRRLDAQENDMSDMIDEVAVSTDDGVPSGKLPSMDQVEKDASQYDIKVREFYSGIDVKAEERSVRENKKQMTKGEITEHKPEEGSNKQMVLPLIDSHSQLSHRRKIVLERLNRVMPELLGPLRLSVVDVSSELRALVKTFNLTSTNIILRPPEWTLAAYFLLRLLTMVSRPLQKSLEGDLATHYFRTMLLSLGISGSEVTEVVSAVCAASDVE